MKEHRWTEPTPSHEKAPRSAAEPAPGIQTPPETAQKAQRPTRGMDRPGPALARSRPESRPKPYTEDSIHREDRRGDPCACGPDHDPRPCLAHAAIYDGRQRRHIRPGR